MGEDRPGIGDGSWQASENVLNKLQESSREPPGPGRQEGGGNERGTKASRNWPAKQMELLGTLQGGQDAGGWLTRTASTTKARTPGVRLIPYTWVLTDTTYFFLAGGVFEHNRHPFVFVRQPEAPAVQTADIVGHSCYADQIVLGARVPDVADGDVLAFLETGAYQESSASNFNSLPRPASVLVHGDEAELIKRAETIGDVYGRDVIPQRLLAESAEST